MSLDTALAELVQTGLLTPGQALVMSETYNRFMTINGEPTFPFPELYTARRSAAQTHFAPSMMLRQSIPVLTGIRSDSTGLRSDERGGAGTFTK